VAILIFLLPAVPTLAAEGTKSPEKDKDLSRGEYLVMISGCNDCHTPGFAESGGSLPRGEWLTGDRVGFGKHKLRLG